jgi:hypothetical protein
MKFLFLLFCICLSSISFSQMDTISLTNPSFEDEPHKGGVINGIRNWYSCGIIEFPAETPPDIHPMYIWGVNYDAFEGKTYLGLVVRDNESWESVSQRLNLAGKNKTPLEADNCYNMSMAVAQSDKYLSGSQLMLKTKGDKSQTYNYDTPVIVRIWGGRSYCDKKELLATSEPVSNSDWETIILEFTPKVDCKFISIEAYYDTPLLTPYNGHVLIDNLSDIIQVACKD